MPFITEATMQQGSEGLAVFEVVDREDRSEKPQ
jgi:hypothetical protein